MFQIDDNFLASVGYDVSNLSEDQKAKYIDEITAEVNDRVSERFVSELNDEQIEEFNDIQENDARASRWLEEFHRDYRDTDEYQQIAAHVDNEADARTFYATALWMQHAVPNYGGLIQEELNAYQQQLVRMRQAADSATSQL